MTRQECISDHFDIRTYLWKYNAFYARLITERNVTDTTIAGGEKKKGGKKKKGNACRNSRTGGKFRPRGDRSNRQTKWKGAFEARRDADWRVTAVNLVGTSLGCRDARMLDRAPRRSDERMPRNTLYVYLYFMEYPSARNLVNYGHRIR